MTDEEKHLEVMTKLTEITTNLSLVVKPAVEQVYKNKDEIIKIKSFQSGAKKVIGVVSTAVIITSIRSAWTYFKHH